MKDLLDEANSGRSQKPGGDDSGKRPESDDEVPYDVNVPDVSVLSNKLWTIHEAFAQDLTYDQAKVLNIKDYSSTSQDWDTMNQEYIAQIVYMQTMKKNAIPPNSEYKGKYYGKDILIPKVLSRSDKDFVNIVVELLKSNQTKLSELTPEDRTARLTKKCQVKEYFDKLAQTGKISAKTFNEQLFHDEKGG